MVLITCGADGQEPQSNSAAAAGQRESDSQAVQQPSATNQQPPASDKPAAPATGPTRVASNYSRLTDPDVARELRLTTEQQEAIKKIFATRDAALEQAAEPDRVAIALDADRQIEAILSPEQRGHLATILRDETVRLQFSFRFQPWVDVLNWFAEQADLSLVLDAPPPGTFNYTDTRQYTVPEAIDLLNGVLLTKGYTLLRRERMLMLVDLSGGVPADLAPRITLEELGRRGKYELVSVAFPIGDRNADEVKAEVQPLIGSHGQIAVLPRTKQLLITETAGKMRAIQAVIDSIPQPSRGAEPAKAEPAKPSLAVFSLAGLDAKATIEILGALFPDVKLVHDSKADQLMIHAAPDKRSAIESVLAQLKSEAAAEQKPQLQRHPIKQAHREEALATLKVIVPEAVLRVDGESGDLIAWATPQQHAVIDENLQKLGQAAAPANERQLEVHAVKKADPSGVLALLQKMLPEARLAMDASTKSIVALASPDDQRAIRATIEQLESHAGEATLKSYALTDQQRRRVESLLKALDAELPGLRLVADASSDHLSVLATAQQHARVEEIVNQVKAEAAPEELQVATYRIRSADPASVLAVLQTLLPEVKFVPDAKSKQIVAWARAEDQKRIQETIEQIDADMPDDQRLRLMSHPLGQASADTLLSMLRTMLPEVQVVSDAKNNALVAWARARDQEVIQQAVAQAQPNTPDEDRARMVVYPVTDADPVQLASMLSTIFPTARFTGDRAAAKLVAWAPAAEQQAIRETVEGMIKTIPADRELTPVVYHPKRADVATLLADLRTVVPEARLAADPKHAALVAWATAADHEKIKATIEGLEQGEAQGGRSVAVYQARDTDATTLLALLQSAIPDARFVADTRAGTVLAWASAEQHETLRKAVEGLQQTASFDNKRVAKVYRFHTSDANAAYNVLRYLVPSAYFAVDTRTGSLAVTALPSEHEQIAAMVEQMEGGAEAQDLELRVYAIESTEPTNVLSMLRELFAQRPEVRFSVDSKSGKLVAWALPSQHQIIQEIIGRVDAGEREEDNRQIEVYALRDADPDSVGRTLNTMFAGDRNVRIIPDEQGGFVTVWAKPEVQASVRAVIEQMQGHNEEVAVLPLEVIDPYIALSSIERLFGDRRGRDRKGVPRVDIDPDGRQLLVRATREQVAQIRSMLAKMGEPQLATTVGGTTSDRRMRVLPISERTLRSALEEIQRVWPQLRDNPIRIVTPSAVAPTVQADRAAREQPASASPSDESDASTPAEPSEGPVGPEVDGGGCQQPGEVEPGQDGNAEEPAPQPGPSEGVADSARKKPAPAIVIAPSGDSITISSDDPEALEQFEQLLKTFVQRSSSGGRDFAIFHLKQANAVNVAETLQNVLAGGGFGLRGYGGASVVADQRLNAVIVQAGRNDMTTIENLIHTLDSADQSSGIGPKPKLIPVKNTSAERIAEILRDVYKTQLTAGGARRPIQLPQQRMSSEMAALMQQISAASTGPEMTLGVDRATNSVVVAAPAPLLKEVEALVHTLDEESNASKPTVRVLALRRINTKALGKALDNLIQEQTRSRRSP